MIWLLFTLIAFTVVIALVWPLLRPPQTLGDRAAYDLSVFRDQLEEVERDVGRGVLTPAEAEAARIEIQRRMLAAGRGRSAEAGHESPQARTLLTTGVAVTVPFAALALYLAVGAPQLPGTRPAEVASAQTQHDNDMAPLVDKLAERMRQDPDNPEGWSLLARSYRQMGRFGDAAEAYRNLMRLMPDDADGYSSFAEVATAAANGTVTAEARAAILRALTLDRTEPRARFYAGLERAQAGDARGAIAIWRELTASAPADAPWLTMVRGQMGQVAQDANIMPMQVEPRHALDVLGGDAATAAVSPPAAATADPSTPDVSALKGRFSAENLEMIQGMVGGLAQKLEDNPKDYDGWMLLGRSYMVLRNHEGAVTAYRRAAALKPAEIAPKVQLAEALVQTADRNKPPSRELVSVAEEIRKRESGHPLALFIVGLAKAAAGDVAEARKLWDAAERNLPADAPLRQDIARGRAALP